MYLGLYIIELICFNHPLACLLTAETTHNNPLTFSLFNCSVHISLSFTFLITEQVNCHGHTPLRLLQCSRSVCTDILINQRRRVPRWGVNLHRPLTLLHLWPSLLLSPVTYSLLLQLVLTAGGYHYKDTPLLSSTSPCLCGEGCR